MAFPHSTEQHWAQAVNVQPFKGWEYENMERSYIQKLEFIIQQTWTMDNYILKVEGESISYLQQKLTPTLGLIVWNFISKTAVFKQVFSLKLSILFRLQNNKNVIIGNNIDTI